MWWKIIGMMWAEVFWGISLPVLCMEQWLLPIAVRVYLSVRIAGMCLRRCGNRNLFRIKRLWCTGILCGKIRIDYMCGFGYKLENQIQIGKTEKRLSG